MYILRNLAILRGKIARHGNNLHLEGGMSALCPKRSCRDEIILYYKGTLCSWVEIYRIWMKSLSKASRGSTMVCGNGSCVVWRVLKPLNLPPDLNRKLARYENFVPRKWEIFIWYRGSAWSLKDLVKPLTNPWNWLSPNFEPLSSKKTMCQIKEECSRQLEMENES